MTILKTALAALLVTMASQADALSCAFGPTAAGYLQAQQDGPNFIAVRGVFTFEPHQMQDESEAYSIPAQFDGQKILQGGGFDSFSSDVVVSGYCINGDCGYVGPDSEQITFLHEIDGTFVAYSMPCASYPVAPTDENVEIIRTCMNGGVCDGTMQW